MSRRPRYVLVVKETPIPDEGIPDVWGDIGEGIDDNCDDYGDEYYSLPTPTSSQDPVTRMIDAVSQISAAIAVLAQYSRIESDRYGAEFAAGVGQMADAVGAMTNEVHILIIWREGPLEHPEKRLFAKIADSTFVVHEYFWRHVANQSGCGYFQDAQRLVKTGMAQLAESLLVLWPEYRDYEKFPNLDLNGV